ncbi:MAG: cache domain-containing protein [Bacteroidota bacterium]
MNRLSVRNRIWGIVAIFIGSIVVGGVLDVKLLRQSLQQEKEAAIRQVVESGYGVLAHYSALEDNGSLSREAAQAAAMATIKALRYNERDYFWINDDHLPSRMVMHPIQPELDGQPLLGEKYNCATSLRAGLDGPFVATDGKKNLTEAFVEVVAHSGQGYVTYPWPKTRAGGGSTANSFPKLSYVKKFAPWGWIIGSGIYIDDIDAAVRRQATENLLQLLGISAVLLLLSTLIARSITAPLRAAMRTMHAIAKGEAGLDQRVAVDGNSEIAELAGNFNDMLDHIEARDQALLRHQDKLEEEVAIRTASLRESNLQLDAELTERRRIEKVVKEGRTRMHAMLDATDESVMLLTPAGLILEINAFAARRFGQTPQQMVGRNFYDFMPPALAESRSAMVRVVAENGEILHFQDQRGAAYFDNSLYPVVDDNGTVESIAVYAKDITEQHRIKLDEELFLHLGTVLMRWGIDSAAVAQIFCDGVMPIFNLCGAAIVVAGPAGRLVMLAGSEGMAADAMAHMSPSAEDGTNCLPVAAVMASGQRQVLSLDGLACPACAAMARTLDAREAALLPLVIHGECWGVLVLYGQETGQFGDGLLQQRLLASANRLVITLESALRQERLALLDLALAEVGNAVMITDANGVVVWVNRSFCQLSGYALDEVLGKPPGLLKSGVQDAAFYRAFWATIRAGETWRGDIVNRRKDGALYTANEMVTPLFNAEGELSHYVAILEDISERKRHEKELQQNFEHVQALNQRLESAQNQLLQSEKMASIGQLAAGVAHEINNPIGFVNSNLGTLKLYVDELLGIIQAYGKADALLVGQPEITQAIETLKERADLGFLNEDIQVLLRESREGIGRVSKIVQDLKDFSRIDSMDWAAADLEQGLDSTLNIVCNEIKYKADIVKEYAGIPRAECLGSQMNQVFMNLLVNAAQAIETRGTITLRTGCRDDHVWVEIADTGKGMPPEIRKRIFEPFFTTKPVGKGTGLGLSLAYSIVQKHHGKLEVESELGRGSTFRIEIPLRQTGS